MLNYSITSAFINEKVSEAISQDFDSNGDGIQSGFISLMVLKGNHVLKDIPIVFEMFSILSYATTKFPIVNYEFKNDTEIDLYQFKNTIVASEEKNKLILFLTVDAGDLPYVAHWISDSIPSQQVKSMAGLLAIPFSIELHAGNPFILPEWCAAFYVNNNSKHCIPTVTLHSMANSNVEGFSGDWTENALHRLSFFNLPVRDAQKAVQTAPQGATTTNK
ncbi:TPA: hypothetical protein U5D21_002666 [Yersinia enterocolitica]|nr:hypothetical protein [Yersinia enterocolitica]